MRTGDDLIVKFWKHTQTALRNDAVESEYLTRWDGSQIPADAAAAVSPIPVKVPSHAAANQVASEDKLRPTMQAAPVADYPPINHMGFDGGICV